MPAEQKAQVIAQQPQAKKQFEVIENLYRFVNYLEGKDPNAEPARPQIDPAVMQMMQQQAAQPEEGQPAPEEAQAQPEADQPQAQPAENTND